jgi:RecA-family ATPase
MTVPVTNAQAVPPPFAFDIVNAYDLYVKDLPPTKWIVKPIIHEGLTLLIGDPKVGKSFFGLQIAAAVASGAKSLFGFLEICARGKVLYLALDDGSEKRLHNRMHDLQISPEAAKNIDFVYQRNSPDLSSGFDKALDQLLSERKYVLVILDTFGAVLGKQGGKSIYREDYQEAIKLQKLAQRHGIALLILHHTNKGESTDVIARASGSHGLTGAVDSVLMLSRETGYTLLAARPRDAEESEFRLERLPNGAWTKQQMVNLNTVSVDDDETPGTKQQEILALLRQGPKTRAELAGALGISDDATRKRLVRMAELVQKNPDGTFQLLVRVVPGVACPSVLSVQESDPTTATPLKLH